MNKVNCLLGLIFSLALTSPAQAISDLTYARFIDLPDDVFGDMFSLTAGSHTINYSS